MSKKIFTLLASVVILISSLIGALVFVNYQFTNTRPNETAQEVIYEIAPGKGFNLIAEDLEAKGLIRNAALFKLYARYKGLRSKIKVGEYLLQTNMLPQEVLQVLVSGKSIARSFTVSEGLSTYEIAELYEKQGFGLASEFMSLIRNPQLIETLTGENLESLEGYLFPETYKLTKYTDTKTLITNMVKRFLIVYDEILPQSKITGMNRNEIVTLASIVEKETGASQERPLIASVFHNRLRKKMRLQTDPTIIYGKAEQSGKIQINITLADLKTPTRYNTYTIEGLPPTPIANPGKEALLATITPADSNYLFFVSKNDGTHIFSEDYKEHQKAVKDFQVNAKAREGHSWRELSNKGK